jgi:hypothetical protein
MSLPAATKNHLIIPTNYLEIPIKSNSGSLTLQLDGRCEIQMAFDHPNPLGVNARDEPIHWEGTLEANWKADILLVSDSCHGISVNAPKLVNVDFEPRAKPRASGNKFGDCVGKLGASVSKFEAAMEKLKGEFRAAFGSSIDVSSIMEGIHDSFNGPYTGLSLRHTEMVLVNPVFNSNGDFFVQLVHKGDSTISTTSGTTPGTTLDTTPSTTPSGGSIKPSLLSMLGTLFINSISRKLKLCIRWQDRQKRCTNRCSASRW